MNGWISVPVVMFAFTNVLQVANTLLALLWEFVYSTVDVLTPRQRAGVRATASPITHDIQKANAFVNKHECYEQRG